MFRTPLADFLVFSCRRIRSTHGCLMLKAGG
jgi:hypothetical protein